MAHNWIIRFESKSERDAFKRVLAEQGLKYNVGEFLPDIVVYELDSPTLERLRARAPRARFFDDIQFHPMG